MEVAFRLTRDDFRHYVQLAQGRVAEHAKRASGWRANPTVYFLASASLPALGVAAMAVTGLINDIAVMVAFIAYVWGLLSMVACEQYWRREYLRHFWPDSSPALSDVRMKLTGDGIERSDSARTSMYHWPAFSDLSQSGGLIVLWCDRGEGLAIPERAFADEETRQDFIGTVRRHLSPAPA